VCRTPASSPGTASRARATRRRDAARDARIDLDAVLPGFALTVRELFDTLRID
jgi:hypothetical protein